MVGFKNVVRTVFHPRKHESTVLVAFSGVIEDDVKNDLDARQCSAFTMSRNSFTGPRASRLEL